MVSEEMNCNPKMKKVVSSMADSTRKSIKNHLCIPIMGIYGYHKTFQNKILKNKTKLPE